MIDQQTICAIGTAPGMGAIAIVRLSGNHAIEIADKIFQSNKKGKKLKDQKAGTLHFGTLADEKELIDEVIVALFRAPHSYTGEDLVEINCHGSVYIQQRILQLLVKQGARLAQAGEFTQRAFLNGKMDLSQAEAVADLISSTHRAAQKVAINQMRGGFSVELTKLRGELLHFIAMIELELDFSEEDVEFADRDQLKKLVSKIEAILRKLKDSFQLGNVIKNGIPVAIVGDTNVGKSTLLNVILNEEKAIVSDIHGTTRDVIEDVVNIHGKAFRFFDTAGLRETSDTIETMGIARSYSKLDQATIVILVVDSCSDFNTISTSVEKIKERLNQQHLIVVANKIDRAKHENFAQLAKLKLRENDQLILIAAKQKTNIEQLIEVMQKTVSPEALQDDAVVVTNVRHFEALSNAHDSIERVQTGLENRISGDFLAQDIRECLHYLGEITGEISTDEILGHIFKNFCIGK